MIQTLVSFVLLASLANASSNSSHMFMLCSVLEDHTQLVKIMTLAMGDDAKAKEVVGLKSRRSMKVEKVATESMIGLNGTEMATELFLMSTTEGPQESTTPTSMAPAKTNKNSAVPPYATEFSKHSIVASHSESAVTSTSVPFSTNESIMHSTMAPRSDEESETSTFSPLISSVYYDDELKKLNDTLTGNVKELNETLSGGMKKFNEAFNLAKNITSLPNVQAVAQTLFKHVANTWHARKVVPEYDSDEHKKKSHMSFASLFQKKHGNQDNRGRYDGWILVPQASRSPVMSEAQVNNKQRYDQ